MDKRINIAVCFYGQVRFLETFNLFYKKLNGVSDKIKFHFYIATWKDFDHSKIKIPFERFYYGNEQDVTEKWKEGNTQKMSYLAYKAGQLKKDYEVQNNFCYDYTLLIRPDVFFDKLEMFKFLDKLHGKVYDRPTVFSGDTIIMEDNMYKIHSDWIFLFTPEAFDIHYNFYSFFYLNQKWRKLPIKYVEGGHWIHAYYFKYNNFIVEQLPVSNTLIRPKFELQFFINNIENKEFFSELKKFRSNLSIDENSEDFKNRTV